MGNIYSFEKNNKNEDNGKTNKGDLNQIDFTTMVDDIALDYIFTQNTIDLIKISDKEYYDNMFILTQEILKKRLSSLELGFLNERVLNGISEKVYLQDKKKMTNLIPKNDKIKRKLLNNVSMYYMKIILIFSAIVSTSDPLYYYIDPDNNKKEFYLKDIDKYKDLPSDVKPKISHFTNPFNLCKKRLDILSHNLVIGDNTITINPGAKLCNNEKKTLNEEIGISELDALYCDIFDRDTKKWSKKSPKMEKQYKKDLILFYQIFTGNKFKPENIKSFSQIELIDFKTLGKCNKNVFKNNITLSKDNKMIIKYLNKIKKIQEYTEKYKSQMIKILQQLFLYSEEDKMYKLHPQLTLKTVQKMEIDTREIILKLYTTCEKYFLQAILIFEKIYQEQNMNVNTNRSYNLEGSLIFPETINKPINEQTTLDQVSNKTDNVMIMNETYNTFVPETPANASSSNVLPETPANVLPSNVIPKTPANVLPETPANVLPETPANVLPETPANVLPETPANASSSNVLPETPANASSSNVLPETPANVPSSNVLPETPANVLPETPANTSSSNVLPETPANASSSNVLPETPAIVPSSNVLPETPAIVPSSNVLPETPANVPSSKIPSPRIPPTNVRPTNVRPTNVRPTNVRPTNVRPTNETRVEGM